MSTATINGLSVTKGRITFRLVGAWDASLDVMGTETATISGNVVVELGGVPFVGFATPATDSGGHVSVRVVGGFGGLNTAIDKKGDRKVPRGLLLSEVLALGGEKLSTLSDAAIVNETLPHWGRRKGTVAEALRALVTHAGSDVHWRTLPDGTIWVGKETWVPIDAVLSYEVTAEDHSNQRFTIAIESAAALPGMTVEGYQISEARYELSGSSLRTGLSYAPGGRDELAGELSALIRRETSSRDLEKSFAARAVAQNADGTLEIKPIDSEMPDLSEVPVRLGMPGITEFKIIPPVECSYGYENGDPSKPFVSAFGPGTALSLTVGASTRIKLEAPLVEAGGSRDLVFHDMLAAWVAQLAAAGAPIGLSVPPLVGANTIVLKGG